MRQRIEVTGAGIVVTSETEPLVSMFGKLMRPGSVDVVELSWEEISSVSVTAIEVPPDELRWVGLTVDTTWGDSCEVHEEAHGYVDAVRELCRRSGLVAPVISASPLDYQLIWSAPPP